MNSKLVFGFSLLMLATAAFAATDPATVKVPPKVEKLIQEELPICPGTKLSYEAMVHKLPINLTGTVVKVESSSPVCEGQYLAVTSIEGGFYLGLPWFLDDEKGQPTLEEKLKHFTWTKLQDVFEPVITRTRTREGLYPVTLYQTTERGKLALEGEIDPEGTVLFIGHFRPMNEDIRMSRLKAFEPLLADEPATGATKPVVTVIEFSDFECPSCKHASGFMKPILDKYGDKVRYIRYDLPLFANHPWALAAAISGRAIYRQKPDLFWEYKKQIYANQDNLTAFTIGDFARGFAQDHDLDLKKYDADVASDAIKDELINGTGVAFSNDIRATPSYLVNGALVEAGTDGKQLEAYVASLLK